MLIRLEGELPAHRPCFPSAPSGSIASAGSQPDRSHPATGPVLRGSAPLSSPGPPLSASGSVPSPDAWRRQQPAPVPTEHLQPIALPVCDQEQVSTGRLAVQLLPHQPMQALVPFAHVSSAPPGKRASLVPGRTSSAPLQCRHQFPQPRRGQFAPDRDPPATAQQHPQPMVSDDGRQLRAAGPASDSAPTSSATGGGARRTPAASDHSPQTPPPVLRLSAAPVPTATLGAFPFAHVPPATSPGSVVHVVCFDAYLW